MSDNAPPLLLNFTFSSFKIKILPSAASDAEGMDPPSHGLTLFTCFFFLLADWQRNDVFDYWRLFTQCVMVSPLKIKSYALMLKEWQRGNGKQIRSSQQGKQLEQTWLFRLKGCGVKLGEKSQEMEQQNTFPSWTKRRIEKRTFW